MIEVVVPATTANLGPGFDTLGMALDIEARFTFTKADQWSVRGCPEAYCNENNLVLKAYRRLFEQLQENPLPINLHIDSSIPLSRGLGSSAACILAGLMAANAMLDTPLSALDILKQACAMEGHPDNVTPALMGGLKGTIMEQDCLLTADFAVSDQLRFAVLIPDFKLETVQARKVLPNTVTHGTAVANLGKLAMLLKGLETADAALLQAAMDEHLHEPYRQNLIEDYDQVRKLCLDRSACAVFISGSGPTLLTIWNDEIPVADLDSALKKCRHSWQLQRCRIHNEGAQVKNMEDSYE